LSREPALSLVPRRCDGGVMLAVRLTPKSAKDEIRGVDRSTAPLFSLPAFDRFPKPAAPNQALEKLIAKWLGVPPSR
jgi:uncharacterized protein YggU (UPF0235/DUF167 family)